MKTYIENIDYITVSLKGNQTKQGGYNKELVLLTPDTFKMLTMKSKTAEAQKIRYYYITLEKLVEIHKDEIIRNQTKKIEALERNLKKHRYPVEGAVYIMKVTDEENEFKIGKTNDMNKRRKSYNTSHKDDPEIVYIFYTHDTDRLEKCVKLALTYFQYRPNKEFYKASKNDIIEAIKDCNELITKFKSGDKKQSRSTNDNEKEFIFTTMIKYDDVEQRGGYLINANKTLYMKNKQSYISTTNFTRNIQMSKKTDRHNQERLNTDIILNDDTRMTKEIDHLTV